MIAFVRYVLLVKYAAKILFLFVFKCNQTCSVANYFCSETRFVETVEHACDESNKEVCLIACCFI